MNKPDSHSSNGWYCPACGITTPNRHDECPQCGVIVEKLFRRDVRLGLDDRSIGEKYRLNVEQVAAWKEIVSIKELEKNPKTHDRDNTNLANDRNQPLGMSARPNSEGKRKPYLPSYYEVYEQLRFFFNRAVPYLRKNPFVVVILSIGIALCLYSVFVSIVSDLLPSNRSSGNRPSPTTLNNTKGRTKASNPSEGVRQSSGGEFEASRKRTLEQPRILLNPINAIETQIDGDFDGWDGETVVKLINGEIWIQDEYHYEYTYSFMPDVILYDPGSGWKMKVEGTDEAVRVRRLK